MTWEWWPKTKLFATRTPCLWVGSVLGYKKQRELMAKKQTFTFQLLWLSVFSSFTMMPGISNRKKCSNLHLLNVYCMSGTVLNMGKYTSLRLPSSLTWTFLEFVLVTVESYTPKVYRLIINRDTRPVVAPASTLIHLTIFTEEYGSKLLYELRQM